MSSCANRSCDRTLLYLSMPPVWPMWPFLPVVRRTPGRLELGVVVDTRAAGLTGYSSTVFLGNLFFLPNDFSDFIKLSKEVFDSAEELADSGWRVD